MVLHALQSRALDAHRPVVGRRKPEGSSWIDPLIARDHPEWNWRNRQTLGQIFGMGAELCSQWPEYRFCDAKFTDVVGDLAAPIGRCKHDRVARHRNRMAIE